MLRDDWYEVQGSDQFLGKEKNFNKFDVDADGCISRDDLEVLFNRSLKIPHSLNGYEKALVDYLLTNFERVESAYKDAAAGNGITQDDIAEFDALGTNQEKRLIYEADKFLERTRQSQVQGICYGLYSSPENPSGCISADAVRQGTMKDCYFLSTMACIAEHHPEAIADMIHDNKDGTYTVTFPGGDPEGYTVAAPTQAEMGLYNAGHSSGTWAVVMEKAYAQWRSEETGDPAYVGIEEGEESDIFELLTGKGAVCDNIKNLSPSETKAALTEALSGGAKQIVVAAIDGYDTTKKSVTTPDGFQTGHGYSVLDFDPSGPDGGTVTVRNPWGDAKGTPGGEVEMSLDEFRENFDHLAIGEK